MIASAGLSIALTAALAALSVGWRGPSVWWVLWALAASWALWVLLFGLIAPLTRYSSRASVARLIERRDPELQDALLTSVDVLEGREVGDPELSEALAERVQLVAPATARPRISGTILAEVCALEPGRVGWLVVKMCTRALSARSTAKII